MAEVESSNVNQNTICDLCKELNLTEETKFNVCKAEDCQLVYCVHMASAIDPTFCTNCLHDVTVTEEVIQKTQEYFNAEKDLIYSRTRKAKKITLSGMHWLFQARKIEVMSDLELSLAIEYHRDILQLMLLERDERRINNFHRNKGKQVTFSFNNSVAQTSTEQTITKKTKTSRASKIDKVDANLTAALEAFLKAGLTPEMIAQMAGKVK